MSDKDVSRRKVLKQSAMTGAMAVGGVSAASGGSAAGTHRVSSSEAEAMVSEDDSGLVSALSGAGLLAAEGTGDLPTEPHIDGTEPNNGEGTAYLQRPDDPDQLVVAVEEALPAGVEHLRLAVHPDTGNAGAYFETADGEYRFAQVSNGDLTTDVVTSADCGCDCDPYFCYDCCDSYSCQKKDYVCCYSGGLCDYTCGGC